MVDFLGTVVTAIATGLGVSIGSIIFEIYLKDHFIAWKKHRKAALKKRKLAPKKPWLAALLNFFLWGIGYVYQRKRYTLGFALIVVQLFIVGAFGFGQNDLKTGFESLTYTFLIFIISGYLAYDAYKLARSAKSKN